jgi:glycosyltransferase involved in cell wall biosynthesis
VGYLIQAMPEILRHMKVRLHIVGDGPFAPIWKAEAEAAGVAAETIFHGHIPNADLEDLYATCHLFVLPAIVDDRGDTEGQGVVMVEAMSSAMPVVAGNVGGIPDVVLQEKTGILVPQRSPEALAAAIMRVLSDPALAERFGRAGLLHAQDYFNWDRITRLLEEVYRRAIQPEPAPVHAAA